MILDLINPVTTVIFSTIVTGASQYFGFPILKTGLVCTSLYLGAGFVGYVLMDKLSRNDKSRNFLSLIPIGVSLYKIFIFWSTIFSIYNFVYFGLPYLNNLRKFLL